MPAIVNLIRRGAAEGGLNLVAAIPAARYTDAVPGGGEAVASLAPNARSIVVIGNGGRSLWSAIEDHSRRNPGWWNREHPIDDFTVEIIEKKVLAPLRKQEPKAVAVYPFIRTIAQLDFMALGRIAGLGGPSILGVLAHPVYGPWIAFRAALMVEADLDEPGTAVGFDPCPSCATRPCIGACPGRAVAFPDGWMIPRCVEHRVEIEADCAQRCDSRAACVLGPEHRYPDAEIQYHQMRAFRVMRPHYLAQRKSP